MNRGYDGNEITLQAKRQGSHNKSTALGHLIMYIEILHCGSDGAVMPNCEKIVIRRGYLGTSVVYVQCGSCPMYDVFPAIRRWTSFKVIAPGSPHPKCYSTEPRAAFSQQCQQGRVSQGDGTKWPGDAGLQR